MIPPTVSTAKSVAEPQETTCENDLLAVARELIVRGKEQGYLTLDEVLSGFHETEAEPDTIVRLRAAFDDMGIEVSGGGMDPEDAEQLDGGTLLDIVAVDVSSLGDPVSTYLKEISRFTLLTAEDEVELARAIEAKPLHDALNAVGVLEELEGRQRSVEEMLPEIIQQLVLVKHAEHRGSLAKELLGIDNLSQLSVLLEAAAVQRERRGNRAPRSPLHAEAIGAYRKSSDCLTQKYARAREARQRMTEANLRLVISIAKRYIGRGVSFLDLIQEGNLGLIRAVDKFDHRKGYRFSTYATWWIWQAIRRVLADQSHTMRIPVHLIGIINKQARVTHRLSEELGREPNDEEIAEEMGINPEGMRELLTYSQAPLSLDTPIGEEEESHLGDSVEDHGAVSPLDAVSLTMLKSQIEDVLDCLAPRERRVLQLRFGLVDGEVRTLAQIGKRFGLGRERVRQIEAKALSKLRQPDFSTNLRDYLA